MTIDEATARAILKGSGSPAYSENWQCRREDGGLVFSWRREAGRPPMGTYPWVVTDDGQIAVYHMRETIEDTFARARTQPKREPKP